MFDSHTHLEEDLLKQNRNEIIDEFIQAGGKGLLNVGYTIESNLEALKSASSWLSYPEIVVKTSIGLHPTIFCQNSNIQNAITNYNQTRK
ncbi:TatD family hydrolase, partial [Candidatus Dojkabacteria bacterium]|nr:TatD family hydrolase [Candidatus Dojkabacteria bacterium]